MSWVAIDRRAQSLCDRLAADPAAVRCEAIQLLRAKSDRPAGALRASVRLRLLGIVVSGSRKLGELAEAEAAAKEGAMIVTRSAVANADFLLHLGALRIVQERAKDALKVVNRAELMMTRELEKPAPSAKESQRRRRWIRSALASARVTRGQIFVYLSEGSSDGAFADALEALRLTSDLVKASAYTRRVHLAGVTLLCTLLLRFGTTSVVVEAVRLLDHAERILIYRCRVPPDHAHRIKIKWGRALALARLGKLRKAETLLLDVIERLTVQGLQDDARHALDALVWVIEQTRMPGRAGYYQMKYGG